MGKELECVARFDGKSGVGKAHLDSTGLVFRGEFRLKISQEMIRGVVVEQGVLTVQFGESAASFELGGQAEKWAEAIRNPPGLLQKLGVKVGQRVGLLGFSRDDVFEQELVKAGISSVKKPTTGLDWIFLRVERPADLETLSQLQEFVGPKGGVWVVYPKGVKVVTEGMVLASAREAGFAVPKVCRFSETHTAHKLVLPKNTA